MSTATVIHMLPSPTGLEGNLNPKVASLCQFQTAGARNKESTHLSTAMDGKSLSDLHAKIVPWRTF